jgi:integrase
MTRPFRSRWGPELREFVAFRQASVVSSRVQSLRLFDAFAAAHPGRSLAQAITGWLDRNPRLKPTTRSTDLFVIRQFCLYRRRFDPDGYVPEPIGPALSGRAHFRPCLLSRRQIKQVLRCIAGNGLRGSRLHHARVRLLFLVLYCTGLRVGEAVKLRLADVDLRRAYFRIGPSKGRIRLVPFGRDLAAEIGHWLNCRRRAGYRLTPQTPVFEREDGRAESRPNACMRLNTVFRRCGFKPKRGTGRGGLRVHDLRHIFAVHRLERWYRAGLDPGPRLPWLSAYLGHVNLLGTQRYLHATAQTLGVASRRFRRSLGFDPARP